MSFEFPNTINTDTPSFFFRSEERDITILLNNKQFIELVKSDNLKTIFKCKKTEDYEDSKTRDFYLFLVKEGFCFYTDCYDLKDYEEFFNVQQSFEESGFTSYLDLVKAKKIGTDDVELFSEFCESDFHNNEYKSSTEKWEIKSYIENNSRLFKKFIEAKKRGFNNKLEYNLANILNIDYEQFDKFQMSKYWRGISVYELKPAYEEFKKAMEEEKRAQDLGFETLEHYKDAMRLGFKDENIYSEFLQSKCKTREEFEFFKNLPHILEIKIKKIDEIVNDANSAYNSERFEEYIRLKFLSIEIITEALYFKTFRKEVENKEKLKVDDIINKIESQLNENLVDHEELKYWRRIRNNIIHKHAKIEKDNVEKGKEFFEALFKNLNKYLSE